MNLFFYTRLTPLPKMIYISTKGIYRYIILDSNERICEIPIGQEQAQINALKKYVGIPTLIPTSDFRAICAAILTHYFHTGKLLRQFFQMLRIAKRNESKWYLRKLLQY